MKDFVGKKKIENAELDEDGLDKAGRDEENRIRDVIRQLNNRRERGEDYKAFSDQKR